jgi:GNAT superfamily N-acetyltransferase
VSPADIRRLTLDDLPACLDLAADRDWPREEHKWRLLFGVGEVYGIVDDADVIATTIVTRYGGGAAISMVLVAARHERRGLGSRLMRHVLERSGDGAVMLYATELGRPLYERLGFESVGAATAHVGRWEGAGDQRLSRPATDRDAIAALDAAVTGLDRRALIVRLPVFAEQVRVVERDGELAGYAATWQNVDALQVGPVIAADEEMARGLITDLVAGDDRPLRVDIGHEWPALRAWATVHGLAPGSPVTRMAAGGRLPDGDPARHFAPLMQALG